MDDASDVELHRTARVSQSLFKTAGELAEDNRALAERRLCSIAAALHCTEQQLRLYEARIRLAQLCDVLSRALYLTAFSLSDSTPDWLLPRWRRNVVRHLTEQTVPKIAPFVQENTAESLIVLALHMAVVRNQENRFLLHPDCAQSETLQAARSSHSCKGTRDTLQHRWSDTLQYNTTLQRGLVQLLCDWRKIDMQSDVRQEIIRQYYHATTESALQQALIKLCRRV